VKTTIEINEHLLRRAKHRAAIDGTTLRSLFEEALQRLLDEREGSTSSFRLRDGRFHGGTGTAPGVDLSDWNAVRQSIDMERWQGRDRG
jgi:Bacterial antitoxin of type II TA system, VapB